MIEPVRYCMCCTRLAKWVIETDGTPDYICSSHVVTRLTHWIKTKPNRAAFSVFPLERFRTHRNCMDCHVSISAIREWYMVFDKVWLEACDSKIGLLCVGCLETRLGRRLVPGDFTHCPLNSRQTGKSKRLRRRLGHHIRHA